MSVTVLSGSAVPFALFGIPVEFFLFGLTLLGVALFHRHTIYVALTGLFIILVYKEAFSDYSVIEHVFGTEEKSGEWDVLLNLLGLLTGFTILADHFERSGIPDLLPSVLPDNWKGGFVLLIFIGIISSFLDNIAAAMIGGAIAHVVYKGKVHIGFIAAIVAASNAGGAGSVVGDTTTTMMWIDGVRAGDVLHAYIASIVAILVFGIFASRQQHAWQPIISEAKSDIKIDSGRLVIALLILAGAIMANVMLDFPAVGVWAAIFLGALFKPVPWRLLPAAFKGSVFLLSLVMCASMMPVERLPHASWQTAFALGFFSSVFDNIPLTKLALDQGGYDWGVLAFSVGFGGSMIWFGSSAGVAISNLFQEARSVGLWIRHGWHIIAAYVIGFLVLLGIHGWHPHAPHKIHTQQPESLMLPVQDTKTGAESFYILTFSC